MQYHSRLSRFGALCGALLFLAAGLGETRAQVATESPPQKSASPDELSQTELLKSYLHVREQLHAAELAIVNNRLEAEAAARTQAAAMTEKLDAIKSVMAAEREHQQAETLRVAAEHERQQLENERTNRTVLWVASSFGAVGLLAMFLAALFQWRALNRLAEITTQHPALPGQAGLLAVGLGASAGEAVAHSNQRLQSVIDRMERRILELEHTAVQPLPTGQVDLQNGAGSPRREAATADQTAMITALLGKARSLLNTNKAREAVASYDEILKLDANHPEALVKKASALERLQQDQEALQCYDRAIKADRNMVLAYLGKGGLCNRLQRYEEAVECYDQALLAGKEGT